MITKGIADVHIKKMVWYVELERVCTVIYYTKLPTAFFAVY